MKVKVKNLVDRNGHYYFRCRIPGYASGREIRVSLDTTDLQKAIAKCNLLQDELKRISETTGYGMIDRDIIEKRIYKFIRESLASAEDLITFSGEICPPSQYY